MKLALAAGIGLVVEERLRDDSTDDDILSDELVTLVNEVETHKSESSLSEVEPEIYDLLENELDLIAAAVVVSESESIVEDPVGSAAELYEEDLTLAEAVFPDEELSEPGFGADSIGSARRN